MTTGYRAFHLSFGTTLPLAAGIQGDNFQPLQPVWCLERKLHGYEESIDGADSVGSCMGL